LANEHRSRSSHGGKSESFESAEAEDRATKWGEQATEFIDSQRSTAASGLKNAAEGLHATADQIPGEAASRFAHQAADKMSDGADYLKNNAVKDMSSDLGRFVKAHPVEVIVGALLVGFFVGRAARI
jgi:ElaB/YqjD/DUF883 family membrane-anchored ribosome-binding protein